MQKRCSRCKKIKPLRCFHKDARTRSGYCYVCKECRHIGYECNREKIRKSHKAYNDTHKEEKSVADKRYREANKDRLKRQKSEYYYKNKGIISQKNHLNYVKNRRERINKGIDYKKKRIKEDPLFAFSMRIRNLIHVSLFNKGYSKRSTTAKILGASYDYVWEYLLSTWEKNYGKSWDGEPYHIDHIIPLATAKTEEDIVELCHYTNLQMLTPRDNLTKGATNGRANRQSCLIL